MSDEISYVAKFSDGPFASRFSMPMKGFPPDEILAFEMQFFMEGSIAVRSADEVKEFLTGDHIYRKIAQSVLFDQPEKLPIKNVQPGATYEYVSSPEPTPDFSSN